MGILQAKIPLDARLSEEKAELSTNLSNLAATIGDHPVTEQNNTEAVFNDTEPFHRTLPIIQIAPNPFAASLRISDQNSPPKEITYSWNCILPNAVLFDKIQQYLKIKDLIVLQSLNKQCKKHCTAFILQKDHRWEDILFLLQQKKPDLNQRYCDEPSQHSLDLDRSVDYFSENEQIGEQQSKLNRVLTALSFEMEYFQGLLPMCAALLYCFDEHSAYLILPLLIAKCKRMQERPKQYLLYKEELDRDIQQLVPKVYDHFRNCDLEIDYFAMSWIMGLFSQDLHSETLMQFWSALCFTDLGLITCLVAVILRTLQQEIIQCSPDELNELLKKNLKEKLPRSLVHNAKRLYLERCL